MLWHPVSASISGLEPEFEHAAFSVEIDETCNLLIRQEKPVRMCQACGLVDAMLKRHQAFIPYSFYLVVRYHPFLGVSATSLAFFR